MPLPAQGEWLSVISLVRDRQEHYQGLGNQMCAVWSDKMREETTLLQGCEDNATCIGGEMNGTVESGFECWDLTWKLYSCPTLASEVESKKERIWEQKESFWKRKWLSQALRLEEECGYINLSWFSSSKTKYSDLQTTAWHTNILLFPPFSIVFIFCFLLKNQDVT